MSILSICKQQVRFHSFSFPRFRCSCSRKFHSKNVGICEQVANLCVTIVTITYKLQSSQILKFHNRSFAFKQIVCFINTSYLKHILLHNWFWTCEKTYLLKPFPILKWRHIWTKYRLWIMKSVIDITNSYYQYYYSFAITQSLKDSFSPIKNTFL